MGRGAKEQKRVLRFRFGVLGFRISLINDVLKFLSISLLRNGGSLLEFFRGYFIIGLDQNFNKKTL
jgi:hypothetical protein